METIFLRNKITGSYRQLVDELLKNERFGRKYVAEYSFPPFTSGFMIWAINTVKGFAKISDIKFNGSVLADYCGE